MLRPLLLEIPVTLHLSKDAEAKLTERAAATGKPLADYIAAIVGSVIWMRPYARGNERLNIQAV